MKDKKAKAMSKGDKELTGGVKMKVSHPCPFPKNWRGRTIRSYWPPSPGLKGLMLKGDKIEPTEVLKVIKVDWKLAPDSDPVDAPQGNKKLLHRHADFEVEGRRVHWDLVSALFRGPLSWYTDSRIYIDGVLRGFGGCVGLMCAGSGYFPAKAIFGPGKAIVEVRGPRGLMALPNAQLVSYSK